MNICSINNIKDAKKALVFYVRDSVVVAVEYCYKSYI